MANDNPTRPRSKSLPRVQGFDDPDVRLEDCGEARGVLQYLHRAWSLGGDPLLQRKGTPPAPPASSGRARRINRDAWHLIAQTAVDDRWKAFGVGVGMATTFLALTQVAAGVTGWIPLSIAGVLIALSSWAI